MFTVTLSKHVSSSLSVSFSVQPGTAVAGSGGDYTNTSGSRTFTAAGSLTQTISINVAADVTHEPDENFTVTISNPTFGTITDAVAVGTIVNDDPLPTISLDPGPSVTELYGVATETFFTFRLSNPSSQTITADAHTIGGSATAGVDFTSSNVQIVLFPGQTSITVPVTILHDAVIESDETFQLVIDSATTATIGTGSATATISDRAAGPTELIVNDVTLVEGHAGTSQMVFTVGMPFAPAEAVVVSYTVVGGSATADPSGVSVFQIAVDLMGDLRAEAAETLTLVLSPPAGLGGDHAATGTITNDDAPPTLTITLSNGAASESSGPIPATISRTGTTEDDLVVLLSSSDETVVRAAAALPSTW